MRSFYLLFLPILAGSAKLKAQYTVTTSIPVAVEKTVSASPEGISGVRDTITTYLDRATSTWVFSGASGYVLGTNPFATETGAHFSGVGNVEIREVLIYFGRKTIMGAGDTIEVRVSSAGADSFPDVLKGSSLKTVNSLITTGAATRIPVTHTGTPITGDFTVTVVHGGIDDTVALISNNPFPPSGPDGKGEKRAIQFATGSWQHVTDIWEVDGFPFDADALIVPIVETVAVSSDDPFNGNFALLGAVPNPTREAVEIRYELKQRTEVQLTVFDLQGKVHFVSDELEKLPGAQNIQLDTDGWAAGVYYYTLRAGDVRVSSRFTVVN